MTEQNERASNGRAQALEKWLFGAESKVSRRSFKSSVCNYMRVFIQVWRQTLPPYEPQQQAEDVPIGKSRNRHQREHDGQIGVVGLDLDLHRFVGLLSLEAAVTVEFAEFGVLLDPACL